MSALQPDARYRSTTFGGAMTSPNPVLNGRDPVSGESLQLSQNDMVVSAARVGAVGHYVPSEWRVAYDWTRFGVSDEFMRAVTAEANLWNRWARTEELSYPPDKDLSTSALFSKTAGLRRALDIAPTLCDVSGKRILDIGGSCKDSIYFIYSEAARVDQIEVSAQSQRLALDRLHKALTARSLRWEGRVFFHTVPAEQLPFGDSVFDFVFSRSTVHHLSRPDAFYEIHRVLKPGGILFFVERYLGAVGHRALRAWRGLRGVDRGTDMPLRIGELESLRGIFSTAEWHLYNVLDPLAYFLPPARGWLRRLQDQVDPSLLRGSLGTKCWVVAKK
jgi:SAM-dependent methyltransferase